METTGWNIMKVIKLQLPSDSLENIIMKDANMQHPKGSIQYKNPRNISLEKNLGTDSSSINGWRYLQKWKYR